MSSLRNAVQRRNHKERGQLASRERLGLLEKKKDYVLRAKDFHSKEKRLKALREKAAQRNPDEFYFKMINSNTKGGKHVTERNAALPVEMISMLKSQDKNYIKTQREISKKKMQRLQESLHFIDDQDMDEEDMLAGFSDEGEDEEEEEQNQKSKKSNHVVFVDTEEEVKKFNPAKHLNTLPELVNRKFNRPTVDTLKKNVIANASVDSDDENEKEMKKARRMKYKELASRIVREQQLSKAEREIEIQRAIQSKGKKKRVGTDENGLPVYKWKADRKK
ncbi:small-subunit processome [Umbelopsis sp. AD052]|nr:small-subunit processome [Umbelopsis sp. AD052]